MLAVVSQTANDAPSAGCISVMKKQGFNQNPIALMEHNHFKSS